MRRIVEQLGPNFVTLRGQGGEEIAISAGTTRRRGARIRASTLFFDQRWNRFSDVPLASRSSRMSTDVGRGMPSRHGDARVGDRKPAVDDTTQSRSSSASVAGLAEARAAR